MTSLTKTNSSDNSPGQQGQLTGELHLGTIGESFDESRDIAFGPHCFLGREDVFAGWWDYPFIDPFADEKTVVETKNNVVALTYSLLPGIVERLNAFHGTSYSAGFWRILAYPWLSQLIERAWTSYATLQIIKERLGGKRLSVRILQSPPENKFKDSEDFLNSILKDYNFNWWIDSEVASVLADENWQLVPSELLSPAFRAAAERQPIKKAVSPLRRVLRNIKYRLGYSDIVGIRWSGLALALYANLLPKKPADELPLSSPADYPEFYFPEDFVNLIARLADITMPRSMLDDFGDLVTQANKLPYRVGRLRVGILDHWNDQEKIIAATAKEAGEILINCQHGGSYGFLKHEVTAHDYDFNSNIFISWGWTLDEPTPGHILALPGPYLSKLANRHRRRTDDIIVVGNPIRLRLGRVVDGPSGAGWLRYCEHTLDFLQNLSGDIRRSTIFRPYVKTVSDVDIGHVVAEHFPDIPMLEGDLHGAMMKCKLLVIGNCSTTLNISLAANIPTVVYWHDDFICLRDQAIPYFEALKGCGIMFSDAAAAAAHINSIGQDVEGWWNSREVQDARKSWTDQYARTDKFWWWQWMKALPKLKNVG